MLLDFEFELFFNLFDEGVEVFAGDFLDFFALSTDERVVAAFFFFDLAADVAFYAVDFVDEVEFLENLNNAVDGDGVEINLVLLESNFGNPIWGK